MSATLAGVALALAPAVLLLIGAALLLWPRARMAALLLACLGPAAALGGLVLTEAAWPRVGGYDAPVLSWSPLGLYGVTLTLHPSSTAFVLTLPPLLLAALGVAILWRRQRAGTGIWEAAGAAALVAVAGSCWAAPAGDLVSLTLATCLFLVATGAMLWAVAGAAPAGRRLLLVATAAVGLETCVLILGKVNGLFLLSQLSTVGFTSAAFAGLFLTALVAAPVPPFQGWLQRLARHPLAPAVQAAGAALALRLLLVVFQVTAGSFASSWQHWLALAGWLAVAGGIGVVLLRRGQPTRLASLAAGRAGFSFLAAAIATPGSMAAALLYATLALPPLSLLWLLSLAPSPAGPPRRRDTALWKTPGFWIVALLLASAAGLPGTVGGLAKGALIGTLTAAPAGNPWLRLPPFLLDGATLIAGSRLLWRPHALTHLESRWGWALLALAVLVLAGPFLAPALAIARWFGPAALAAAGTANVPLAFEVSRVPSALSLLLGGVALLALVQRIRGREWLPGPVLALLAVGFVHWEEARRRGRRERAGAAPAMAGAVWQRASGTVGRVVSLLRPLEERYYAAAAILLAIALIYVVAR